MAAWYTSMNPNTYDLTPTKPWDYESLRVDKTFRFHLTTQQKECMRWSRELNGLKDHIRDVMQLVAGEINKLEDK